MFIGVYLCISGIVYWLGLALLVRARVCFWAYSLLSFLLTLLGIIAFIGLSAMTNLMPVGGAGSWSYPGDYLNNGPSGWIIMIIPLLGMVSPLLVGLWIARSSSRQALMEAAA